MGILEQRDVCANDLDSINRATARLLGSLDQLTDADIRRPSLLPGWSVGHCLTHIARNADGIGNLVTWAVTGTPTPMYESMDVRNADIEAGASRSAQSHRDDVRTSSEKLARAFEALLAADDSALDTLVLFGAPPANTPPDTPVWQVPYARLREVMIHHADLGLPDFSFADFDDVFVQRTLSFIESRAGSTDVHGPASDLLAWRLGRTNPATLRDSEGNPPGPAPAW